MLLPKPEKHALPPSIITFNAAGKMGQPPTSQSEHGVRTALAHFGVGTAFGLVYGLASPAPAKQRDALVRGALFGFLVWSVNYLGILPALNLYKSPDQEPARRHLMMIAAHLIWGLTTGQVYRRLAPLLKKRLA